MGNAEFHPASDRQICKFDSDVFTATFPELATIVWSSIFGVLFYLFLIGFVIRARSQALKNADSAAAAAVVLPSYLPVLYLGFASALTQIVVVFGYAVLCDSSYLDQRPWLSGISPLNPLLYAIFVLSYDWFTATIIILFFFRSVSKQSLIRACLIGLMFATISAVLSGFAIDYVEYGGHLKRRFEYLLMIAAQLCQLLLLLGLCSRPGRRSSSTPFLVHSVVWRLFQIIICAYSLSKGPDPTPPAGWMILLIQVVRTALLPPIVYWTLLLDTWYWRGVPRRKRLNEHALRRAIANSSASTNHPNHGAATTTVFTHPEAAGGLGRWLAQPRYPPRDPANDRLQQLLDDASDLIIDHAFLSIDYESLLGRGASASVFHGTLTLLWGAGGRFLPGFSVSGSALFAADPRETSARSVEVAVKIYTPPELDEEAILAIKDEMSAWGELSKFALRSSYQSSSISESVRDVDEADLVVLNSRPPNLVRFFGMCVMPPHLSLVFEFCEGGALSEWINLSSPPPAVNVRLEIVLDCALAVHFLHSNGFIHRDLKAANFLLKRGTALLTDFGTCLPTESNLQQTFFCSSGMIATTTELKNAIIGGTTVGTIDHMAPELLLKLNESGGGGSGGVEPGRLYSSASDVYALAVVVASVLAFRAPFPNLREWNVRELVLKGERPFDLEELVFHHNMSVREWIRKAFAQNPMDRPSALELIEICETRLNNENKRSMM